MAMNMLGSRVKRSNYRHLHTAENIRKENALSLKDIHDARTIEQQINIVVSRPGINAKEQLKLQAIVRKLNEKGLDPGKVTFAQYRAL